MRVYPEAQPPELGKNREMVGRSLAFIAPEALVDEDGQRDGGSLAALLPPYGPGGHVAGIGDLRIRLLETFEVLLRKVHLSTHGKSDGAGQSERHGPDGLYVLAHVIADISVAARQGTYEKPVFVIEDDGDAVYLLLLDERQPRRGALHRLVHPGDDLLCAVCLVEREDGYRMGDFGEVPCQIAAHAVGGTGVASELGMGAFDAHQLVEPGIVFQVAHDGPAIHVVGLLRSQQLVCEPGGSPFQIHAGSIAGKEPLVSRRPPRTDP